MEFYNNTKTYLFSFQRKMLLECDRRQVRGFFSSGEIIQQCNTLLLVLLLVGDEQEPSPARGVESPVTGSVLGTVRVAHEPPGHIKRAALGALHEPRVRRADAASAAEALVVDPEPGQLVRARRSRRVQQRRAQPLRVRLRDQPARGRRPRQYARRLQLVQLLRRAPRTVYLQFVTDAIDLLQREVGQHGGQDLRQAQAALAAHAEAGDEFALETRLPAFAELRVGGEQDGRRGGRDGRPRRRRVRAARRSPAGPLQAARRARLVSLQNGSYVRRHYIHGRSAPPAPGFGRRMSRARLRAGTRDALRPRSEHVCPLAAECRASNAERGDRACRRDGRGPDESERPARGVSAPEPSAARARPVQKNTRLTSVSYKTVALQRSKSSTLVSAVSVPQAAFVIALNTLHNIGPIRYVI